MPHIPKPAGPRADRGAGSGMWGGTTLKHILAPGKKRTA